MAENPVAAPKTRLDRLLDGVVGVLVVVLSLIFVLAVIGGLGLAVTVVLDPATPERIGAAVWPFAGTALGAAATLLGTLVVRNHQVQALTHQREVDLRRDELATQDARIRAESEGRLRIEAMANCLVLLTARDGNQPSPGQVSGTIAALAQLHRPAALAALRTAWAAGSIPAPSAVSLVSVLLLPGEPDLGDSEVRIEAAGLLHENAGALLRDTEPGHFHWPRSAWQRWPGGLPTEGEYMLLSALRAVVLARQRDWWDRGPGLLAVAGILRDAWLASGPEPYFSRFAWALLGPVLDTLHDEAAADWGERPLHVAELRARHQAYDPAGSEPHDRDVEEDADVLEWKVALSAWR